MICHPNPCLNGGACKENGNGFDCICDIQYTGSLCEGLFALLLFLSCIYL